MVFFRALRITFSSHELFHIKVECEYNLRVQSYKCLLEGHEERTKWSNLRSVPSLFD
jgi:hypothetical protein